MDSHTSFVACGTEHLCAATDAPQIGFVALRTPSPSAQKVGRGDDYHNNWGYSYDKNKSKRKKKHQKEKKKKETGRL